MPSQLKPDEKRFIRRWVDVGADVDRIHEAERKARVRVGTGKKMLKLVRVQTEVERMLAPIRQEQERQRMVSDVTGKLHEKTESLAAELAETKADLALAVAMPLMTVDETVLEHELMRIARLDPKKFGAIKLAGIQAAYVVKGLMKNRSMERLMPAEKPAGAGKGIYEALFDQLRGDSEVGPLSVGPEISGPPTIDGAADLMPVPVTQKETGRAVVMPAMGEAIDVMPLVAAKLAKSKTGRAAQVITVEVG